MKRTELALELLKMARQIQKEGIMAAFSPGPRGEIFHGQSLPRPGFVRRVKEDVVRAANSKTPESINIPGSDYNLEKTGVKVIGEEVHVIYEAT